MSIREVTYYQVVCDEPGCVVTTETVSDEYSAWSDSGQAVDHWVNVGLYHGEDGRDLCDLHSPKCPGCGLPTQADPTESSHEDDCPTHQHEWGNPTNYLSGRSYRECQTRDAMKWVEAESESPR